ncbi:MAG: sporulation protein YunB [Bacillota bacterium]
MFRRRRKYGKYLIFLLFVGFLYFLLVLDMRIRSTVYEMAEVRAVQMATEAINNSVRAEVAEEGLRYQDFVDIHKDQDGKIVLMQSNTVNINKLATGTTLAAQSALLRLQEDSFYIPMGQLTGIYLLANKGPKMKVEVIPMGTVRVNIDDRFEQAGINQTRHCIYLDYDTDVRIVVPLKSGRASVSTSVPVAESIIIGDVPSTFVTLPEGIWGAGMNKPQG